MSLTCLALQAITDGSEATVEADLTEERKERRKKKKSREPEEAKAVEVDAVVSEAAPAAVDGEAPAADAALTGEGGAEDEVLDEKERKKLEKKKRKAEREAAAKAAMEAELEALAAAEAELAKLEAESAKTADGTPAAVAVEAAASESAPAKCESGPEVEVDECLQPQLHPSSLTPQQATPDDDVLPDPVAVQLEDVFAPVELESQGQAEPLG